MVSKTKLVQADVRRLPDGNHNFGQGLYLRVSGASRTWAIRIQVNGRRSFRGLGSANNMTLSQARVACAKKKAEMISGDTLTKKEKTYEQKRLELKAPAFEDVWEMAVSARERVACWKGDKQAHQWRQSIRDYAVPTLGKLDVSGITRQDILRALQPIWLTKPDTATKVRNRLEIIFDFFIREGMREKENPARWKGCLEFDLPPAIRKSERKHHEAAELKDLVEAAPSLLKTGTGRCALFGILTACRLSEFLKAKWCEIDFKTKTLNVPQERRKDGKPIAFRVPLSHQAMALLESQSRETDFIFPGKVAAYYSLDAPRKALRDVILKPITMHGCRSTFRDWCAENGVDPVIAEKCLMHATGNEVEQAYQRSDLLDQRRKVMQAWADVICKNCDSL